MTTSKSPALWAAVAVVLVVCANAQTRNKDASLSPSAQNFLSLDFANNGQSVAATVGEQIELTLLVGPALNGDLQISSPAIRLENTAAYFQPNMPPPPGGVMVTYMLEAVAEGEVQIKFPVVEAIQDPEKARTYAFSMTIRVGPGAGNHSLHANLRTDQANTVPWKNRWANLDKPLFESFVPSLPNLTAVEVELLAVDPGPSATGEIDMMILNPKKMSVASLSKTVSADDCSHVLFLLPRGGLQVSPGQVYTIQLGESGGVFGWKYVVGDGLHALGTFLFKTFGKN